MKAGSLWIALVAVLAVGPMETPLRARQGITLEAVTLESSAPSAVPLLMLRDGQLSADGFTLQELVAYAYGTEGVRKAYQVVGGDEWVRADRFSLRATVRSDSPIASPNDVMPALRGVLSTQFALDVSVERRQFPVLELRMAPGARSGGLKPSGADCGSAHGPTCGFSGAPGIIVGRGLPSSRLASRLEDVAGIDLVVVDRTGLEGRFDFMIDFPVTDSAGLARAAELSTSLRSSVGLQLVPSSGSLASVRIVHARRP